MVWSGWRPLWNGIVFGGPVIVRPIGNALDRPPAGADKTPTISLRCRLKIFTFIDCDDERVAKARTRSFGQRPRMDSLSFGRAVARRSSKNRSYLSPER